MTVQIMERIVLDGKEYGLASILDIPTDDPRIISHESPEHMGQQHLFNSTACWRRYQGSWEIRDSQLFLSSINGKYQMTGSSPIFASWYSGELAVPQGKRLLYLHGGFGGIHEQDLMIRVEHGRVLSQRVIRNRVRTDPDFCDLNEALPL